MGQCSILAYVIDTNNIPETTDGDSPTIRPNIEWPVSVWKAVKIAAIQADANPGQFVVEKMAELVGAKAA